MQAFEALIVWAISFIIQATTTFLNYTQNLVLFVCNVQASDGKGVEVQFLDLSQLSVQLQKYTLLLFQRIFKSVQKWFVNCSCSTTDPLWLITLSCFSLYFTYLWWLSKHYNNLKNFRVNTEKCFSIWFIFIINQLKIQKKDPRFNGIHHLKICL